ncbi:hypothetical protein QJQ45_024377, partial [Haematococcus lacustris]
VIKVPEGAVLRGCKKTRRKLRAHLQLRAEIHSQLRVIASLFVRSATQPPAVQPPQPPDAPPLPTLPPRAPAQPTLAQPASMECDIDSNSESGCGSELEPQSDTESESEPEPVTQPPANSPDPHLSPPLHPHPHGQGKGIVETREYVFDPDTQIGVGIDPGVTQAVSAASFRAVASTNQAPPPAPGSSKLSRHLPGGQPEAHHRHPGHLGWGVGGVPGPQVGTAAAERLYGAQDRALEQFFNKLEEDMAEVSMERHGHAKQLAVFFGAAGIGTGGGWGADAVLRACCKVVCRPRGAGQRRGRVVLVDEHCTTRVSSAVNGKQPCEEELNKLSATRPAGWKPPAGQVEQCLLRPAWSQQHDQPVRGLMWCPVVPPRKPPQAPRSSQEATPAQPGPSTPPPAERSKRTKAEPAAEPIKGKGKGKGKAAKAKPAPQLGRWRPLELCYWPDQGALPAKGKEYPGMGYKRLRDKPCKAQQQQQQPAEAQ